MTAEAAVEDGPGAPTDRDPPALNGRLRQHRRGEKVAQLMREVAEPLASPSPSVWSRWRLNSVTALAMALSRQRFRVWNSSGPTAPSYRPPPR